METLVPFISPFHFNFVTRLLTTGLLTVKTAKPLLNNHTAKGLCLDFSPASGSFK